MDKEIKNSVDYIYKKTGKNTGFSIPSDYFNNLEYAIETKLLEENFKKESGFRVPDTYFNNLEDRILNKILTSEKEKKVISFKSRIFKIIPYAAAASVLLFMGLNSFIFSSNEQLTIDSLSDTEIENWLDVTTLNTNDISIILEDKVLEEIDFYFTTLKDETIEDYINSIDNIALLNEIN
jgi:hypothetical protein